MKRVVLYAFLFLLFLSVVSSADISDLDAKIDVDATKDGAREKSNALVEKEIAIPEGLKGVARVVFGIKQDDKLDIQTFVLYVCFLVLLVLLIHSAVEVMFNGWVTWAISICVALLGTVSGVLNDVVVWYYGFSDLFSFLERWGVIRLAFAVIFLLFVFVVLMKLFGKAKSMRSFEEFRQMGQDIGFMAAIGKVYRGSYEK